MPATVHDLRTLIRSYHPVIAIESVEEERIRRFLDEAAADLCMPTFEWSAAQGLCKGKGGRPIDGRTTDPRHALAHLDSLEIEAVFWLKDMAPFLQEAATGRLFREVAQRFANTPSCMVLTGLEVKVPGDVEHAVVRYDLKMPTAAELNAVLDDSIKSLQRRHRFDVQLSADERGHLLNALSGMTINQARQAIAGAILDDGRLDIDDYHVLIQRKAEAIEDAGVLEYYPAADNAFELGGFDNLKQWLQRAALGFSEQARAMNLQPPRGILLTGVQGCGKSLAAKAIARNWKLPLLKLDAGRLYNKYIGESDRNFRKATAMAESLAPVVLWIDEIEKAFAGGTGSGDNDGGTSRRLFGAFLTWMQEKKDTVFVVGTANDLFRLPPEFLRKGRFDEIFFVDLPQPDERDTILRIHLQQRNQSPERFDIPALVAVTEGFSGAEIEQAVIGALYRGLYAQTPASTELMLSEVANTVPLSRTRAEDLAKLRAEAAGRFVPVHSGEGR